MRRRRKESYFESAAHSPKPVIAEIRRRVHFSEVDPMGIVWYGRYPLFLEDASEELNKKCGLSYADFYEAGLRAPIVTLHLDYYKSLRLDEEFQIRAALIWHEGARLNTEYYLRKEDGSLAAAGYTVQLLTDAETGEACLLSPPLLQLCRTRWMKGDFHTGI